MTRTPVNGKLPWDTSCDATRAGLERMMRALVVVDGHFTDSHTVGGASAETPSRNQVHFRVWIPVGKEQQFRDIAKAELTEPPRVRLGMGEPSEPTTD